MSGSVPLLRGSWVRRRLLLPFALLVLVVSAALVAALSLADTRTAVRVCLPMLVLAVAGLPGLGAELAEARRAELGIAAVRGVHGLGLSRLLLPEPLLALLVGALVGNVLGIGLARALAQVRGLRQDSPWTTAGVLAQLVVLALLLAGLALGTRGQARRPLFEQVSVMVRRRPASTTLAFAALLVLTAAALAGYRSRTGAAADGDWLVAAGPGLCALAAGGLTLAVLGLLARLLPGSSSSDLARWLATRSMARRRDRRRPQVLGVAAAVLALFALLASASVSSWVGENARLRNGAALRIPVHMGGLAALELTHEVDPDGRWLMAAQVVADTSDPAQRLVLLDTARYRRVAAPALANTAAGGLDHLLGKLRRGPSVPLGDGPTVTLTGRIVDGPVPAALRVRLDHVDPAGGFQGDQFRVPVSADGTFDWTGRLAECAQGCAPTALGVQPVGVTDTVQLHFDRIGVGGTGITDLEWASDETGYANLDKGNRLLHSDSGLDLGVSRFGFGLTLARSPLDVVSSGRIQVRGDATLPGTGGALREPVDVGHVTALPFVVAGGVLADLPRAAVGAGPTPVSAQVYVLARDDTPASVLRRLPGADAVVDLDAAADDLRVTSKASRATLYAAAALAALLVGLAQLLAQSARTAEARDRERADLRRVGVPDRVLTRARRLELVATIGTGAVVAVAGALVAWWLFGDTLALVDPPAFTPAPTRGGLW